MSNLVLLSLFTLLTFIGCKKDEQTPKTTADLVKGAWHMGLNKYEYYNSSNEKTYEELDTPGGVFAITDQNIRAVYPDGTVENVTYTTSESNGKKYIHISQDGITQPFVISTLTENNMTWLLETPNDTYYEGSTPKTAVKSMLTVLFQK